MSTQPPVLPGFDALAPLGSGGFSEVFLYEQHLPRRRVAVKLLHGEALGEDGMRRFADEANLMAQLSAHPSILTVYQAGVTESGRPYLVLEYCGLPDYGARYRSERIPVAEALRTGIQIAGALETAHRVGVLHRDIKPSNVLMTDYRRPVLADFGIAGLLGGNAPGDAYSLLWAPPEALGEGGVLRPTSDVYSLAATVYALLAGRAPFEGRGGSAPATPEEMLRRVQEAPPAGIGRPDVPPELEALLITALAPSPSARPTSALSLGRALQQEEARLGLPPTELDLRDDPFARRTDDTANRTAPTAPTAPLPPTAPTVPVAPAAAPPADAPPTAATVVYAASAPTAPMDSTVRRDAVTAPLDSTVRRERATAPVYTAPERTRSRWPGILLDVALVVAVAGAAAYYLLGA